MANPEHWQQVCELVGLALEAAPEDRQAILSGSSLPEAVRGEAASLLESHNLADEGFLAGDVVSSGLAVEIKEAPVSPWIDRTVGPYRVLREIGHGGMGVVLLAARADDLYERQVAIKVVRADLAGDLFLRRFRKEIRILAGFDHPAIARLLDAGVTEDGYPYLVMEYVAGVAIDQFCREHGCDVASILKMVMNIADAVSYAHDLHVVHRDIKPGNILVTADGNPKLLDFGIAKLLSDRPEEASAQTELRAWTPAYASPEQLAGGEVTSQSDVYSLGALLYCLLTGQQPYRVDNLTPLQMERTFETTRPVAPSFVRIGSGRPRPMLTATDPVVLKALEIHPPDRYSSAAELSADLGRLLRGEPPLARMTGPVGLAIRWLRRRANPVAIAAIAAAAVCVSFVAWHRSRITPAHAAISGISLRPSIAVLPFRNLSQAHDDDWVAAATSEVLSTELAAGDRVRVARSEDVSQAERDLHLAENGGTLVAPALASLARNIDSRYIISGSYLEEDAAGEKPRLRFDVALFDADEQHILSKRSFHGSGQQISTVAAQIAQSMLAGLGLDSQADVSSAERMLPQEPEAVRWYAEGRRHLHELDYVAARHAFERAVAIEGNSALIHGALAETWEGLGYTKRAETEAASAVELSTPLSKRARLSVEGEFRELQHDWPHAIEIFSTLHEFFPDDLDYGLHLARDQASASQPDRALATIAELEKLPAPLNGDPRIPLTGASVAERASRVKVEAAFADRALSLARDRGATQEFAQAQLEQANALQHAGHHHEAVSLGEQAEQSFEHAGDLRGQGTALNAIGNFHRMLGEYAEANDAFTRASGLLKQVGYARGLASSLNGLGNIADSRGQRTEALAFYEQSLALNRQIDDGGKIAGNLNNMANVERTLQHADRARALYLQSYDMYRSVQDRGSMALVQGNIATLLRNEGKLAEARRSNEEELAIYNELGLTQSIIWPLQGLAHTALLEGDLPRARQLYGQASQVAQSQGNREQTAYALCNSAYVLGLMGDRQEQDRILDQGTRLRQDGGDVENTAGCTLTRLRRDIRDRHLDNLDRQLSELMGALHQSADPLLVAETHLISAELLLQQGHLDAATAALAQTRTLLSGAVHAEELRWEVDITSAELAAKRSVEADHAATQQLHTDIDEATRLHNRPWLLNLQLAIAECTLRHDRVRGQALLKSAEMQARAFHAEGIAQIAEADLMGRNTI